MGRAGVGVVGLLVLMSGVWVGGVGQQSAAAAEAGKLVVYQDLEEVTSRIPKLKDKPYLKLIEANGGFFQNETLIFHDLETGNEVWALTRELCTDLANIERRTAWSCNGQYLSFIGNMQWLDYGEGSLHASRWAGHNYVANADGSQRRKLWATTPDGAVRVFGDKFNNWDARRPNVLYYPDKDRLWRITLTGDVKDNRAELIYTFPNAELKIVQEISDSNFMLIEEMGEHPNCYVIDLNKDPSDPYFCLTYPLKGEVHSGSFRFRRRDLTITGAYEDKATGLGLGGPLCLRVSDDRTAIVPHTLPEDPYKMRMAHLWFGPPDDRSIFSGSTALGGFGLWVHVPGSEPVMVAKVEDGHPSWCGHDPEWAFYAVGPTDDPDKDPRYLRRLLAANADRKTVKVICTPYDRRRGGKAGYDAIPRPNQSPDATKCWFHSSMLMPEDRYTGSYIAVFRRPYAPVSLGLADGPGVTVRWQPHTLSYEVKGYHVYRSEDDGKTFAEVTREAVAGTEYTDATVQPGRRYVYAVTSEEWSRLESDVTSPTLRVTLTAEGSARAGAAGAPAKGWDKAAPEPVSGFTAARTPDGFPQLTWHTSDASDLRYYNVYASSEGKPAVSQKRLLVSPTHDQTGYLDWSAGTGAVHYALTAVDRQGNESEPVFASVE